MRKTAAACSGDRGTGDCGFLLKYYYWPDRIRVGEFLPGTQNQIREAKVEINPALQNNLEAVS